MMNEQFKLLADQAQIGLFEDKSFGWSVIAGTDQHLSKFAELIVRECASIASNPATGCYTSFGNDIKKHFGVEL
jgi:uncharacterized protein YktB (UPF0637 family)